MDTPQEVPYIEERGPRINWRWFFGIVAVLLITALALAGAIANSGSGTTQAIVAPKTAFERPVDVQFANGLQNLPELSGGEPVRGDSTGYKETPPVVDKADQCGVLPNWRALYECMKDEAWYVNGVNQFASETGFNWDDVRRWATLPADFDTRAILIANWPGKTDQEARNDVRDLIGSAADDLPIVRHDCIVNTRGLERHTLSPFSDCKMQVRVFLAPLTDTGGKITGFRKDAGVFVDCYNLWWLPKAVHRPQYVRPAPPSGGASVPPRTTITRSTPPRTTIITTPPRTTTIITPPPTTTTTIITPPPPCCTTTTPPPVPKDPSRDPEPNGNAPVGGGHNDTDGPGIFIPREEMENPPSTSRTNAPEPEPTWVPPEAGGPTQEPTSEAPPPPDPGVNGTPGGPGTVTEPDTGEVIVDGDLGGF